MAKTGFRGWIAYQKAFLQARAIMKLTRQWPERERRMLTDQILRSSRSVCSNLGESYGKRSYPKHFRSKVTDASSENAETQVWLDIALDNKYIDRKMYDERIEKSEEIGRILTWMEKNTQHFCY